MSTALSSTVRCSRSASTRSALHRSFSAGPFLCLVAYSPCLLLSPLIGHAQSPLQTPEKNEQPQTCKADRNEVTLGELVKITISPERSDLIYAFGSSAGTLIVKGNEATLNTTGAPQGAPGITVVCSAVDSQGNTVRSTVFVAIPPPSTPPPPPQQPTPHLSPMTVERIKLGAPLSRPGFQTSVAVAPTLSWTTGTQTQTISGGNMLLSTVRSSSYCDPKMRQLGMAASASDTATTKLGASTINVDNNELKLNATTAAFSRLDVAEANRRKNDLLLSRLSPRRYADSYVGVGADFFGNNSLGIGLQQTYTVEYQRYLRNCTEEPSDGKPRLFASVGVGAGFMNQRLKSTPDKLNAAVLPLTAQVSLLQGNKTGIPPKFMAFVLLGYMPVLTDSHAYQVGINAGLQIPTRFRWLTFTLNETDLYMNNAPIGSKRNYQNGTVSAVLTFPPGPQKQPNPILPESAKGACYGGDKLARLYCFDNVTIDACAPPNLFRTAQHCTSAGAGALTFEEMLQLQNLQLKELDDLKKQQKPE